MSNSPEMKHGTARVRFPACESDPGHYFLAMQDNGHDREVVMAHLERILSSKPFRQAERSAVLLRYLVTRTLDGEGDRLKEYTVGVEALTRGHKFDPRTDPIVRAEASRLRARLDRYYKGEGTGDSLIIDLPKGSYVARFSTNSPSAKVDGPWPVARFAWVTVGVLALVVAFAAGAWSRRTASANFETMSLFDVELQPDEEIGSDVGTDVVMSPDGSALVFVSVDAAGRSHLRLKRFDGSAPVDLPETAGGRGMIWSPDSRWIAFWASGQLRKIAVSGGQPVVLCEARDLLGGSWSTDGTIIATLDARVWRIDTESRRPPEVVLDLHEPRKAPRWPQLLPGGTHVLYTVGTANGDDLASIEVASLKDGQRKALVQGGTFARYVAPGYLTYVNQGTLYAQRFDAARLTASGQPVPIVNDVSYSPVFGYAQISISETGRAVYRRADASSLLLIALVDSTGVRAPLIEEPGLYGWPSLSPDGRHFALTVVRSGIPTLTLYRNFDRTPEVAWTKPNLDAAIWTRDGSALFARQGAGLQLVRISRDGEPQRTVLESWRINIPWSLGPGDRQLFFHAMDSTTTFDIWTAAIDSNGVVANAAPLLNSRAFETYPAISPDGRWLAYTSNESGAPSLYVRLLADTSVRILVYPGGRAPRWSRTGNRLFFVARNQRVLSITYSVRNGKFEASPARLWTPIRLADTGVLSNYDVGTDGRTIVALLPRYQPPVNQVTIIEGLPGELQRRTSAVQNP